MRPRLQFGFRGHEVTFTIQLLLFNFRSTFTIQLLLLPPPPPSLPRHALAAAIRLRASDLAAGHASKLWEAHDWLATLPSAVEFPLEHVAAEFD